MKLLHRALLLCLPAVFAVATASAQVITVYTSLTNFNNAVGPVPMTVETFTGTTHYPISTGILNSSTNLPGIGIVPGTIQPGVTYSVPVGSGSFFNIDSGGNFNPGGFLDTITGATPLNIAFDAPVGAFGFETNNWMGLSGTANFGVTINFTSGPAYTNNTFTTSSSTPTFFGFVSNASNITSVQYYNMISGANFGLDDFRFTTIPEPSSLALLGTGAAGLWVWWRRRFRRAA